MSVATAAPSTFVMNQFLANPTSGLIMFCKRFKVHNLWEISPGAILHIDEAFSGLVKICQRLYLEDPTWFIGDTSVLMSYGN